MVLRHSPTAGGAVAAGRGVVTRHGYSLWIKANTMNTVVGKFFVFPPTNARNGHGRKARLDHAKGRRAQGGNEPKKAANPGLKQSHTVTSGRASSRFPA